MFVFVFALDRRLNASWISIALEISLGILVYVILLIIMKAKLVDQAKSILKKEL